MPISPRAIVFLLSLVALLTGCTHTPQIASPAATGSDPSHTSRPGTYPVLSGLPAAQNDEFKAISNLINQQISTGQGEGFTGAAVLIAHRGQVLYQQAFGYAQRFSMNGDGQVQQRDRPIATSVDTLFDLASVTKVAATTVALMHLVSENTLSVDDTLGSLLPRFAGTDKGGITIRQLLTHRSGLWQWQPTWLYSTAEHDSVVEYIAGLPLRYPPGERRAYSDLGFILLGKIVEKVSGQPLNEFVQQHIYAPLGMSNTGYRPPAEWRSRIAATSHGNPYEQNMVATGNPYPLAQPLPLSPFTSYRDYTLIGEANDGNAWYGLNGVAGHAGLFSNIGDLAILGQTLLNGGGYGDYQLTDTQTLKMFLESPFDHDQALGFWNHRELSHLTYWHPGFTGTQFLIQPARQLVVVLLTNRQHSGLDPQRRHYPSVNPLWQQLLRLTDRIIANKDTPSAGEYPGEAP